MRQLRFVSTVSSVEWISRFKETSLFPRRKDYKLSEIPLARPILEQDILCIGCGYNLRGLDAAGRCPECGLAISDSTHGDLLAFADARWLGKLKLGTSLKLWNIVISIFGSFIVGILIGVIGAPPQFIIVAAAIGGVLGLMATFSITSQEPRIVLTEDPVTLRKFIRVCAVVAMFTGLPHHMVGAATVQGIPALDSQWFWGLLGVLAGLAGLVVFFGELKYLRTFALRARELQLARSTRILMWILGIGMLVVILVGAVVGILSGGTITAGGPAAPGMAGGFAVGMCTASAGGAVLFLWYVVLLVRYRRMFSRALDENRNPRASAFPTS